MYDGDIAPKPNAEADDIEQQKLVLERSFYFSIFGEPFESSDIDITGNVGEEVKAFREYLIDVDKEKSFELNGIIERRSAGLTDDKETIIKKYAPLFSHFVSSMENKSES